jgi:hypothetical protein
MQLILGTTAIARRFKLHPLTVRCWMIRGIKRNNRKIRLKHQLIGRSFRTSEEWLQEFLDQLNRGRKVHQGVSHISKEELRELLA